jgi:hypothetical protein
MAGSPPLNYEDEDLLEYEERNSEQKQNMTSLSPKRATKND